MSIQANTKIDECPASEDSLSIVYCKSTTLLETKKSRLSSSLIRTLSSTMISSSSNQMRSVDNFNVCMEAPENSSVSESNYSKTKSVAESLRVLSFSIYSNTFPNSIDTKEKVFLLRENLEASSNETLLSLTQRFLQLINSKIRNSKIAFIIPSDDETLSSLYTLKPMKKKSGKPDMDLPGFEMGEKVGKVNFDAFSIVFSSSCIKKLMIDDESKHSYQVIQPNNVNKGHIEISRNPSGCCQSCLVF